MADALMAHSCGRVTEISRLVMTGHQRKASNLRNGSQISRSRESIQFVLTATGSRCAGLAVECLSHLCAVEPETSVLLTTDEPNLEWLSTVASSYPNVTVQVLPQADLSWDDKLASLHLATESTVIVLDVDIVLLLPIVDEMLSSLQFCDVLVRPGMSFNLPWERAYGTAIPQYNTGLVVLGPRAMLDLPTRWSALRREFPDSHDQPSFRAALLESGLRVGALSSDFNFMISDYVVDQVRAVHFAGWFGVLTASPRRRARALRNCAAAKAGDHLVLGELCLRGYPRPIGLVRAFLMTAPRHFARLIRSKILAFRSRL